MEKSTYSEKIDRMIEQYALETGLSIQKVEMALDKVIYDAIVVCKKGMVIQVVYDSGNKVAEIYYEAGKHISMEEAIVLDPAAFEGSLVSELLPLNEFNPELQSMVRTLFENDIPAFKKMNSKERCPSKNTVIGGEILSVSPEQIYVWIGGQKAVFEKKDWVPKEKKDGLYAPGRRLKFYVSKTRDNPFQIYVSRSSKRLPELLLQYKCLSPDFECTRRFIGGKNANARGKSIVRSTLPWKQIKQQIIEVSRELNGELIEIVPWNVF